MPKKILLPGWLTLLVLEIVFLAYVISQLQWPGPVQDFWGSIPFIEKMLSSGNWFGADLWVAQNNHRLALPRLAFLVDYRFFHGSNYFLASLSLVLLALEAFIFYLLVPQNKTAGKSWLVYFPALGILLLPVISYNLLNTFNIQWIQCACLALLSCAAYSYGLASGRSLWMATGILLAILCCFTTFSLTAIWPAFFLLLWLHAADKKQWLILGSIFFAFIIIFIFLLPVDKTLGTGSQYYLPALFKNIFSSGQSWQIIPVMANGLLYYLVKYLSFSVDESGQLVSYLLTVFSLLWLAISLYRQQRGPENWQTSSLLAVMFFVVCLGVTTGLGRAFVGELSYGIRFSPVVLLYWAACFLHVMICLQSMDKKNNFFMANAACLFLLSGFGVWDAKQTSERLAEEHNRYGRMQMAYITGNLHANALYENLVPEWRATSYPGILLAIPYLKDHQWGIFHTVMGKLALEQSFPKGSVAACMSIIAQEKPRNNDPHIRNITFRNADPDLSARYPYLLVYFQEKIVGAAFQRRDALFAQKNQSVWIGISSMPKQETDDYVVTALSDKNELCRVMSFSPDYSPVPERLPGFHD